jgi:hypothetical protein
MNRHPVPCVLIAFLILAACGSPPIPCTADEDCEHFPLIASVAVPQALVPASSGKSAASTAQAASPAAVIPVFRNLPLLTGSPAITTAVVIVHAIERNAHAEYKMMRSLAEQAHASPSTLVVAPLFPTPAGERCDGRTDEPSPQDLVWTCSGYKDGAQAIGGPGPLLDSYAVMDQLLAAITDRTLYPNLQRLVVTGIGAGGQFTLRYAAATQSPAAAQAHFVVVDSGSFLYFDPARPGPELSCAIDGGCDGSLSSPYADGLECPAYDDFPYGIELPFGAAALQPATTLKANLLSRQVALLVGDEDTLAHSAGTDLDTSCQANAQGLDRRSRAINYWNYLQAQGATSSPALFVVPGCAHGRECAYSSSIGLAQVFGS